MSNIHLESLIRRLAKCRIFGAGRGQLPPPLTLLMEQIKAKTVDGEKAEEPIFAFEPFKEHATINFDAEEDDDDTDFLLGGRLFW